MKILLSVRDRLFLLNLLPEKSDIVTMRIVADLHRDFGFTEQELVDYEIVTDNANNKIKWNIDKAQEKEIEIGAKGCEIIADLLRKFSDTGAVTEQHIPLYDKFPVESDTK